MENFWKNAVKEVALAAIFCTVFSLLMLSLFTVFVRAYAPSDITITIVNQIIKCVGIFICSCIFVHGERALFKGLAAGLLSVLFTMLMFGAIGGFHITIIFLIELLLGLLFGGFGAVCSKKFRKE